MRSHCLRQAAALAPDDAQVRTSLARALAEQDRREEALAEGLRAIELDPGATDLHNDLGVIHTAFGELDKARESPTEPPSTSTPATPGPRSEPGEVQDVFEAREDPDEARIREAARLSAWMIAASQRDLHLALGKIHDDRGEWEDRVRTL